VPYNSGDLDAVYAVFDDLAKNRMSQAKIAEQLEKLRSLVGTVESASYAGFKELPREV
jgi:hypothetical protein